MANVLITGATGNVGYEVIRSLNTMDHGLRITVGVRDLNQELSMRPERAIDKVHFDFMDPTTYAAALRGCDTLFLLRPPAISAVKTYFAPLIAAAKVEGVKHIVFLSVQGVEKSRIIPHHRIEQLIVESGIPHTFLRPAYFMQNFTTTLRRELVERKRIFLPAGKAHFTLIDIRDIGAVAALVITAPSSYLNRALELTSAAPMGFQEMADELGRVLGITITYRSPNLLAFYLAQRKDGVPAAMILVLIMLHFLPRFQQEPAVTDVVGDIIGRAPISFTQFVRDHVAQLR